MEYKIIFIAKTAKDKGGKRMGVEGQLVIDYAKKPESISKVEKDSIEVLDAIASALGGDAAWEVTCIAKVEEVQ